MNAIRSIRACLGLTQAQLAAALGMTQGNVLHYEQGRQGVPSDVARRLIEHAATLGVDLTFDHIYGGAVLPPPRVPAERAKAA
jgi:putative transcriptional regulator